MAIGFSSATVERRSLLSTPATNLRQIFRFGKIGNTSLATHEQGADTPGRAFSGADGRRSAMETTDFHRQEEHFLVQIAFALEKTLPQRGSERLVVVAPPRAMGVLRGALPPSVRKLVRDEIEKDYVRIPIYEIERKLIREMAEC